MGNVNRQWTHVYNQKASHVAEIKTIGCTLKEQSLNQTWNDINAGYNAKGSPVMNKKGHSQSQCTYRQLLHKNKKAAEKKEKCQEGKGASWERVGNETHYVLPM